MELEGPKGPTVKMKAQRGGRQSKIDAGGGFSLLI